MATWIVGGVVVLIVGAIIWKMIRDVPTAMARAATNPNKCTDSGAGRR